MKEIDKLKEIFLSNELDEDILKENQEQINEWEQSILFNEALVSWKEHDVTVSVIKQARSSYRELAQMLATSRSLTDEQRKSIWARQDAMLWFINMAAKDPVKEIESIRQEVLRALDAG